MEDVSSSRSSSNGCDSDKWETSEDEVRVKSKDNVLPEGFLDPLPHQKSSKIGSLSGGGLLKRAKKVTSISCSSNGIDSNKVIETPSTPMQSNSQVENEYNGTKHTDRHSFHTSSQQATHSAEEIWLIDQEGTSIRRRGRTTCTDIQSMPMGTRVHIETNDTGIPCNIPESILLGSYLGVIARDPVLAPINFRDWRNKGMESFKKKMLAERKFAIPGHVRPWILQSIGVKWRSYKTSLKAEYFNSRPLKEIMEAVPKGVDASQWCQLVSQWSQPSDQERAARNIENAKKQTCPHTMGRVSSVRRQKETAIQDRLLLWKINRLYKDGSWSSDDARQKWVQACELLSAEGLTPEDENVEANEKVFSLVMGPEHGGRVRVAGFGVTPSKYFPQNSTMADQSNRSSSDFGRVARLENKLHLVEAELKSVNDFNSERRVFMHEYRMCHPSKEDH